MIAAAPPRIACPVWCANHWPCDERIGNPNGTYQHDGLVLAVGDQWTAQLTTITEADGSLSPTYPVGAGISLNERVLSPAAARRLARILLDLAQQAEVRP